MTDQARSFDTNIPAGRRWQVDRKSDLRITFEPEGPEVLSAEEAATRWTDVLVVLKVLEQKYERIRVDLRKFRSEHESLRHPEQVVRLIKILSRLETGGTALQKELNSIFGPDHDLSKKPEADPEMALKSILEWLTEETKNNALGTKTDLASSGDASIREMYVGVWATLHHGREDSDLRVVNYSKVDAGVASHRRVRTAALSPRQSLVVYKSNQAVTLAHGALNAHDEIIQILKWYQKDEGPRPQLEADEA
ncbi:MAG: hypothetical protein O7H41_11885 [Planctomycetota bacterium]|nr:hypothetical protein [Planctomycetota bacterium]